MASRAQDDRADDRIGAIMQACSYVQASSPEDPEACMPRRGDVFVV